MKSAPKPDILLADDLLAPVVTKKVAQLSSILNIDTEELVCWMRPYAHIDPSVILGLLHLAITHQLDPLLGELTIWLDKQAPYPAITIDGWMKLINRHPAFSGIEFEEGAPDHCELPQYMQCTIYRSDRVIPIRVREYLDEVKADHPLWKSMPRRMLRHRVLQQCARLAFGISTAEPAHLPGKTLQILGSKEEKEIKHAAPSDTSGECTADAHPSSELAAKAQGHRSYSMKFSRTDTLKQRLTSQTA